MPSTARDTLTYHLDRSASNAPDEAAFTFVDFSTDKDGTAHKLTWRQLEHRVRVAAAGIRRAGAVGERVAIVAPQSLDYVIGFLAAACAGAIAVPLYPPVLRSHGDKLAASLADADPLLAISTREQRASVADFCAERRVGSGMRVTTLEDLRTPDTEGPPELVPVDPADCAYLQYTSGSTRVPSGVEITHANVVANARQAMEAYDIRRGRDCTVGWLPLYHDMGLLLTIAVPVVAGVPSVLMDPLAFVQRPARWLQLLTRHSGAHTAAPDFAYDYCVQRVTDEERAALSLESVATMVNGSEPIRARTLTRFQSAFASCGMRRTTMRPSYGLAEATVFVAASLQAEEPTVTCFDRDMLAQGTARVAEPTDGEPVSELVACGRPTNQEVAVVDPATRRRQEDGTVAEIWVKGPNVGRGYWRRPQESQATFHAVLEGDDPQDPSRHWLRTGDLGMWFDKQLYITGRDKDLVIVDGTNHYPHDIEGTVQDAHPAVRRHHVAAFAVDTENGERLVVVAEHVRQVPDLERVRDEVKRAVRGAVAEAHAIAVQDFVLVEPDSIPYTTSGKVSRTACRESYLAGRWSKPKHALQKGNDGA
ncbi:fatty acyl-AMP ligase [Streptomyces actuosus]|uniref:Fatty acyl-AMP ligase n=1 Tax=Streptomyces actuosus TaxID=1885 RepID=A0ABS2VKI6_STRAS|nr:fatty acyl-AMP ligase [Streptomyces actuosus]MBN0043608.1 fatty acyl-AMP ligase [Streptomyces actuosus]